LSEIPGLAGFDAQANYEAAATNYTIAANRYWPIASTRLVERLSLQRGERVLDVACGPGTSALLAAQAVGPQGSVIAIDYGEQMLRIATNQARHHGLNNIRFRLANMSCLEGEPFDREASFDAVVCVLGVFFVEDMVRQINDLWRLVRPGGRLALTTMGPTVFEPLYSTWRQAYLSVRPQRTVRQPWERANRTEIIHSLLAAAGVTETAASVAVAQESNRVPLPTVEDCWTVVMGTSLFSYMQELSPQEASHVREQTLDQIQADKVDSLSTDVILTIATKAG
jgi:ubiquinone/menaquinone biosynthesis C-methylase UbiE